MTLHFKVNAPEFLVVIQVFRYTYIAIHLHGYKRCTYRYEMQYMDGWMDEWISICVHNMIYVWTFSF